jgi:hypothetical protein
MDRRGFLGNLAGVAATVAALPALLRAAPAPCRHCTISFTPGDPCSRCMDCGERIAGHPMTALGPRFVYDDRSAGRGVYITSDRLRLKEHIPRGRFFVHEGWHV